MMVWREHARNEWSVSIERALTGGRCLPAVSPKAPDPFSLADPTAVERIFGTAGFSRAEFTVVNKPVYYGQDVATALDCSGWGLLRPRARSSGCARPLAHIPAIGASGLIRARGSSPQAAADVLPSVRQMGDVRLLVDQKDHACRDPALGVGAVQFEVDPKLSAQGGVSAVVVVQIPVLGREISG